ncbi:MAG TPA: TetR/AcrR family transcriptional regulator [Burkholderiales bacterium]|nr:TetR/AcrR family transcriptional regulator [Burkholderiales bacterium]
MRRRILDAATAEFASHGFGGGRIERISRNAGTVDRMLYYHFGSKEDLFRAVLEDSYARLGVAEQALDLAHLDPTEGMRALIRFTWNYYLQNPEFIRLLNSENLHRGEHLKRARNVTRLSSPLLTILADLLRRGAAQGSFRRGLDAVQVYLTIASLAYFYLSNRYTLSRFLGFDLMAASEQRKWLRHITGIVLNQIAANGAALDMRAGARGTRGRITRVKDRA